MQPITNIIYLSLELWKNIRSEKRYIFGSNMTEVGYNPLSEGEIIFLNFRQNCEGLTSLYVLKKEN